MNAVSFNPEAAKHPPDRWGVERASQAGARFFFQDCASLLPGLCFTNLVLAWPINVQTNRRAIDGLRTHQRRTSAAS